MISYSLEVSICWCVFFLIYIVALRKETFFSMNRWYLLSTLLLGLTLPLLRWIPLEGYSELQEVAQPLNYIASGPNVMVSNISEASQNFFPIFWFIGIIYLIGILFFTARFINGLQRILKIYRTGRKEKAIGYTLVHTSQKHLPFSFLNYVFISEVLPLEKNFREILKHELNHIQKKHTYDVLFMEIIHILFWWNPLIYLYKKAMKETHEFMADASVLKETEEKIYGQILLRQSNSGLEIALANQFFNSHLKSRIQMMYKDKSKPHHQFKYLMIIPLLIIMALAFSSYVERSETESYKTENIHDTLLDTDEKNEAEIDELAFLDKLNEKRIHPIVNNISQDLEDPIFKVVEEMPRFPGCEDLDASANEKEECAKKKMLEYIYENIKYPERARKLGIQGITVIQFVVNEDGSISDEKILRDIGGGCGNVSLNVVKSFNEMEKRWTPGKQRGKAVKVQYVLPVRYKLQDDENHTADDPICFVDGKEYSQKAMKDLDPNMIDNIKVLKGEEALNQYGNRGENGVILVTTKKIATDKSEKIYCIDPETGEVTKEKTLKKPIEQDDPIFKVVEEMPRFPGCEEIVNKSERSACAQKAMLNYIYTNLNYPDAARSAGIEGMVVVQFIIRKDGSLTDINVVREIGAECGANAAAVLEKMNAENIRWIPGKQRGKLVDVMYTLPVRYKLEDDQKDLDFEKTENRNDQLKESDMILKIIGNPVQGDRLMFQLESDQTTRIFTSLASADGQLVKEQDYTKQANSNQYVLPIGSLATGQYFLTVRQSNKTVTESIIIH